MSQGSGADKVVVPDNRGMETGQDPGPAVDKHPQGLPVAYDFLPHCWGHPASQKRRLGTASLGPSFTGSVFVTRLPQSPLSADRQDPREPWCWEVPALKGMDSAFLTVASKAEWLAFQTLRMGTG